MNRLILASQSPRRQELLSRIGVGDFTVITSHADETYPEGLSPQKIVEHIARAKCAAVLPQVDASDLVIAADTMVFLGNEKLGKPKNEADALRMLTALAGRRHEVCTGVTVRRGDEETTFSETTEVWFRPAEKEELLAYIATGEPMDKAGAYGVQGKGALLVEKIEGDFFNVMGLPLAALGKVLRQFGVTLF